MGDDLVPATPALTDEQRRAFLDHVAANKTVGNVAALRAVGVQGTRGKLRQLVGEDLAADAREARGWSLTKVEQTAWDVATDPEHPAWDRANARILKAYHPAFRDAGRVELTGKDGGPIALLAGRYDLEQLTVEELEGLRALLQKARPELEAGDVGGG